MGCDIHLHIEVKIKGKWHHYGHPNCDRNYQLFAKLAGVRNSDERSITPITSRSGLPEDVTELTKYDRNVKWGSDAHTVRWINAAEIAAVEKWAQEIGWRAKYGLWDWEAYVGCYLFSNSFAGFTEYPDERSVEDVRFVFWFDN